MQAHAPTQASNNTQDARYDRVTAPYKRALLAHVETLYPCGPMVLEIGIGSFGHAELYPESVRGVIGVEPDASKHAAAQTAARACGISLSLLKCAVIRLCGRERG